MPWHTSCFARVQDICRWELKPGPHIVFGHPNQSGGLGFLEESWPGERDIRSYKKTWKSNSGLVTCLNVKGRHGWGSRRLYMTFPDIAPRQVWVCYGWDLPEDLVQGNLLEISFIMRPDRNFSTIQRGRHESSSLGLNTEDVRTKWLQANLAHRAPIQNEVNGKSCHQKPDFFISLAAIYSEPWESGFYQKCEILICPVSWSLSSVQSLSCVQLFATPWTAACQAYLSITNSQSLSKLMSIELVMPSSYLIL